MRKRLLSVFIVLLIACASWPQNAKHLSLQEAITASVSNNNAIKLSALDVQVARAKFRQADAMLLPQANFSYAAVTTNNPLKAFGFKLQQGSITAADFNPKLLNNPSPTLAISLMGGTITSTFLTLLVVPLLYFKQLKKKKPLIVETKLL